MASKSIPMPTPTRTCFVTIGATTSFTKLISAVLSARFFTALIQHGFTDLTVQFGDGGESLYQKLLDGAKAQSPDASKLRVTGFPSDTKGLDKYMAAAKGIKLASAKEGVVVSHAGTGTILGAMRMNIPVIVVPNEDLLDNHQVELAEILAEQGYVVHGRVDDLPAALIESETLKQRLNGWPPVNSGTHRAAPGIKGVMDEEMGFLD